MRQRPTLNPETLRDCPNGERLNVQGTDRIDIDLMPSIELPFYGDLIDL